MNKQQQNQQNFEDEDDQGFKGQQQNQNQQQQLDNSSKLQSNNSQINQKQQQSLQQTQTQDGSNKQANDQQQGSINKPGSSQSKNKSQMVSSNNKQQSQMNQNPQKQQQQDNNINNQQVKDEPQGSLNKPGTSQSIYQQQQGSPIKPGTSQSQKKNFIPINIDVPCIHQDHDDEIMGICFKPNCEKKSRLVCFTCAISTHHDHAQFIVRLTDLAKSDGLFLRNWPQQSQAIEINEYLKMNQPELCEKLVDEQFDRFQEKIKFQLEKCREKVKSDVREKLKRNEKILKDLDKKLDDTYNLQSTKTMIEQLNSKNINQEQFEQKIKEFLTGKNTQIYQIELDQLFQEKKKKVHDHFNVDLLNHFFDKIVKLVEETPQLLWPKNATIKIDNKGNVGGITSGLQTTYNKQLQ